METQKSSPVEVTPYSALALYYDQVMEHVNYHQWANYVKILFRYSNRSVHRVGDLACGTGSLLRFMKGFKRQAFGFDLSLPMLKRAQKKLLKVPLTCADFLHLPLKPLSLDAALVLYDSINYLHAETEILQFFSEVHLSLRSGGILIFDIVTPHLCSTVFKHYEEQGMLDEDNRYERKSFFIEEQQIQVNQFKIWINGRIYEEEHRQKIWDLDHWQELIKKSPFKLVKIFSNFTLNPAHEKSERAHFVLIKKNRK